MRPRAMQRRREVDKVPWAPAAAAAAAAGGGKAGTKAGVGAADLTLLLLRPASSGC